MDKPGKIANITMFVSTTLDTFVNVSFESNGNISVQGELIHEMMPDEFNKWLKFHSTGPGFPPGSVHLPEEKYRIPKKYRL